MWGEPREGTEAYKIKQLAEKRKKEAEEKKLDDLFSKTYRDCLKYSYAWSKNDNKEYVHLDMSSIEEKKENGDRRIDIIEFNIESRHYKITSERKSSYLPDDYSYYYNDELFLNGKKVFAISESEKMEEWGTYYSPISVNAYINEDWVSDFIAIRNHHDKISKEHEIKYAEDPEKTNKLKEDFGIVNIEDFGDSLKQQNKELPVSSNKETKPFWKSLWFWFILFVILKILSN